MPRASKQWLDKAIWNEIHENLPVVLSSFHEKELKDFLLEFLTKEEKTMMAKRLALYLMILGDYSDAEVKEVLKISYETIRTARNSLVVKSPGFKKRLARWVMKPKSFKEPSGFLKMLDLMLGAKSDKKSRAKLLSGDY